MKQVAFKSNTLRLPLRTYVKETTTWTPFCGKTFESQLDINAMKDELGIKG